MSHSHTTKLIARVAAGRQAESPVLEPGHTYASVTDQISAIVLTRKTSRGWLFGFAVSFALMMAFLYATAYLFAKGVGIWGTTIPVGWAFPIVNFVWWIGIGHAGTLISAVLLLLHQKWRTSINRFAEAMTLFAVSCAGLFPLLHLGRPWVFHWLLPYPNTMDLWPNFRSPLVWDVFAVLTYFTVSHSVLVRGPDPRPGHAARPGHEPLAADRVRHVGDGLARFGGALAALRDGLSTAGGARHAAGRLGPQHRGNGLRSEHCAGLAHDVLAARTSSPERFSRASPW